MSIDTQISKSGVPICSLGKELTLKMVVEKSANLLAHRAADNDEHLQYLIDVYVSEEIYESLLREALSLVGDNLKSSECIQRRSPLGFKYFVFRDLCILKSVNRSGLCLIIDVSDFLPDDQLKMDVVCHPSWHFAWKNCLPVKEIDYQI